MLRKLFDEKIIILLNNFLDNPDKKFSLTQISSASNINVSTTLRILDKLVKQDLVEIIKVEKSKFYKLKKSEKTTALSKILRKDDHINEFVERLKKDFSIKKIILDSRTQSGAKFIIVDTSPSKKRINVLAEEIEEKYKFKIQFVEISEEQFFDMKKIELYNLDDKIIWERN